MSRVLFLLLLAAHVLNVESQVNYCIAERRKSPALAYESDELLALTAYVGQQSRGLPMSVKLGVAAGPVYAQGHSLYSQRMGQLNLDCAHCHQANWGRQLLTDTISLGHGTGYPAYRFEWQKIGSLQRRLRACYFGVRAEMPDYGSPDLLALELYLAVRASGLALEVPGVRKQDEFRWARRARRWFHSPPYPPARRAIGHFLPSQNANSASEPHSHRQSA